MSQGAGHGTLPPPAPQPIDPAQPLRVDSVRGIAVAAALALIAGSVQLTDGAPTLVIVPAGAALALAIPGYALSRALFIHGLLDHTERAALAIGLSLCITIVGGFGLNALPDGLSGHSWAIYLTSVSLVACAVATVRRGAFAVLRQGNVGEASSPVPSAEAPVVAKQAGFTAPGAAPEGRAVGLPKVQIAMLGLAGLLVAGSFLVAQLGVAGQPRPGFTDLWLLPGSDGVTVGLDNHEGAAASYRVVLSVNGRDVGTWSPDMIDDGGTWQAHYAHPTNAATHAEVAAALYRPADTTPYRQAHLTIGSESIAPFPTAEASP